MSNLILGIGDLGASNTPDSYIKTYALGSCVAIIIYDVQNRIGAMAHIALPDSSVDRGKSREKPGYFGDTAVPELMNHIRKINPLVNKKMLIVKLAGGASVMDKNNFFNIGGRNIEAARKALAETGLTVVKEDVGSTISRTVTLDISSGMVMLFNPAKGIWEL